MCHQLVKHRHRGWVTLFSLLILNLIGLLSSPAEAENRFDPLAQLSLPPIDRPPFPDLGLPPVGEPPFVPPEGLEKYLEHKRTVALDPSVPPPDAIVPLAAAASVASLFTPQPDPLLPAVSPASVSTSFAGLDQLSLPENNTNPPDTTLAKSGFRIIEAVNSSLRLSRADGSTVQTKSLLSFLGAFPNNGIVFDPRVIFDRIGPNLRFYVIAAQLDTIARKSNMYFAVSRSPNPVDLEPANWCRYWIPGDPGTPEATFADYPMLGAGADTVVLSVNQATYSFAFGWAVLYAFDKLPLADNAVSCPTARASYFQPGQARNDLNIYSLQPVEHYSAPSSASGWTNPVYLISTRARPTSIYRVWAVRNVASGGAALSVVDVDGAYVFDSPSRASQAGTAVQLDTNNSRVRQAAGRGNALWAAHSTACSIGALPNESCARVVRLDVTPGSASSNHQVTYRAGTTFGGGANVFYWMPGIAVNVSLQTAISFQHSSPSSYLSASWSIKNDVDSSYPVAQPLTTGTCPMTQCPCGGGGSSRTGDYVGAQTNPNDSASFWLAGERATTLGGSCRWDTRIIQALP